MSVQRINLQGGASGARIAPATVLEPSGATGTFAFGNRVSRVPFRCLMSWLRANRMLGGCDPSTVNDVDAPDHIRPQPWAIDGRDDRREVTCPAFSLVSVTFRESAGVLA